MHQTRLRLILFIFLISLGTNTIGQEVSAILQKVYQDKDSLTLTLTLKNETKRPIYLVGGVDVLTFDDYFPTRVNYGSFKEEVNARKKSISFDRSGNIKDTICLVIPTSKDRYQMNYRGREIDVFKTLSDLHEDYYNRKMSMNAPVPPSDDVLFAESFLDEGLYKLIQENSMCSQENICYFAGQIILLEVNEEKNFDIDLGYLLLRNATYQIRFDYRTDKKLFKKETKFLKSLGYYRFKGRISSNVLNVVSE